MKKACHTPSRENKTQEAIYLSNRTQLRLNSNKNPYELWKGISTSVKHLKVFRRKCFIKINDKNIGNFGSRVDEGILLR